MVILAGGLQAQFKIDRSDLRPVDKLDKSVLPALDNEYLKSYYNKDKGLKPYRFAEPRDLEVDFKKQGQWESLKSGQLIWRHVVASVGAHTINLAFSHFELTGDAELYVYNPDQSDIYGPFTKDDNDDHLQLWTPIIGGDEVVIELRVSPQYLQSTKLVMSRLNHDFADIRKSLSGSCNLDVACGSEDGWGIVDGYRDIISSVGAYTLNGIDQCSGALINNTAQDCTPYFLTAAHCSVNNNTAPSVVVYWNYENQECRQPGSLDSGRPGNGLRNNFNSGVIHRATLSASDMTLVEMDDPIDPSLNLFFAGWDRSYELPDTAICIHHPGVEEKRISFEFDPLDYDPNGQDTAYVLVNDWDIGTTEGGSSGSPLFNPRKRIIGQLLGGLAACGNDEYDTYGWVQYSWDRGGNNNNSLKPWLDPLGLNPTFLDGKSCSFNLDLSQVYFEHCAALGDSIFVELTASEFFDPTVNYSVTASDMSLDADLSFTQGNRDDVNILTISGLKDLEEDRYSVDIEITDGLNSATARVDIELFEETPEAPALEAPFNNEPNVSVNTSLGIKRVGNVINEFQLSTDSTFVNNVESFLTAGRIQDVSGLENGTRYFWRVRSQNACGESGWSEIFAFETVTTFCTRVQYTGEPIEIPSDGANAVEAIINFQHPIYVEDVNVLNVNGTHDYISDLDISLKFNNQRVLLMSELCDDLMNFNLGFDDEAERLHIPCPPTDSMMYQPNQELSLFQGKLAGGEWGMLVEDLYNFDGGFLQSWEMEVCFAEAAAPALVPENHRIDFCDQEKVNFNVFYSLAGQDTEFEIRAFDRNSNILEVTATPLLSSLNAFNVSIDTKDLEDAENGVILEMLSLANGQVLAMASITLVNAGVGPASQIESPEDNSIINPSNFQLISWNDVQADAYLIQLATDSDFLDVVFQEELSSNEAIDVSNLDLLDGMYYLRIISYHACSSVYSDVVAFTLDSTTSTSQLDQNTYSVFPNPSTGIFILKNSNGEALEFEQTNVYDVQGRLVYSKRIDASANIFVMDLSELNAGMYVLKAIGGGATYSKVLIRTE